MIGIDVRDRALLRLDQSVRVGDLREELHGLQIDDAAEAGDQMGAARTDHDEEKILKIYKGLSGGMGAEIASAQHRTMIGVGHFRATSSGSPAARSSSISETLSSARIFLL